MRVVVLALTFAALHSAAADAFDIVGHRGSRGHRPENTIAAFKQGARLGATVLEADLVGTKDRRLVLSHERRVSALLCKGPHVGDLIKDLTLEQVRRLDCGTRRAKDPEDIISKTQVPVPGAHIPELAQIVRTVKPTKARLLLELKVDPRAPGETLPRRQMVNIMLEVIKRERMGSRVAVQSYDWRALKLVQKLAPRLEVFGLVSRTTVFKRSPWLRPVTFERAPAGTGIVLAAERAEFDGVAPDQDLVTPELIQAAHERAMRVIPYTVDSPDDMQRLIGMGVDGLITDFPDRLVVQARRAGL